MTHSLPGPDDPVSHQPVYSLIVDGQSFEAYVYPEEGEWQVLMHGTLYNAHVEDEREKRLRAAAGGLVSERDEFLLRAPMPGLVIAIPVTEGQQVTKGEVLVILESMKMQNELKAPRDGTVARPRVAAGDHVEQKQVLTGAAVLVVYLALGYINIASSHDNLLTTCARR